MHGISLSCTSSGAAGVVELVDALRSGRSIRKDVPVRVRPSAFDENEKGRGGFGHLSPFCARYSKKIRIQPRRAEGRMSSGSVATPNTSRSTTFAAPRVSRTNWVARASDWAVGSATPAPSNNTRANRAGGDSMLPLTASAAVYARQRSPHSRPSSGVLRNSRLITGAN